MSKKLSICVPHYKEPFEKVKPLLDSIAIQQGISMSSFEVIIAQDGEDGRLDLSNVNYPFDIKQVEQEHKGVSAARNLALDNAEGDYVMFSDCDDVLVSNYGLHLIFSGMQEEPEALISAFVEEQKDEEGNFSLIRHSNDSTFVHGKCYKRKFLIDNNIRFNEGLYIHEDSYFNVIAIVSAELKRAIETPIVLWKWHDDSTVRLDSKDYVLKTYDHLMKTRTAIAGELEKRGFINEYIDCVVKTVLDSYYDFNKEPFLKEENKELINKAKLAFKGFYEKFQQTYKEAAVKRKVEIAQVARNNAVANGMVMESCTISEFLNEILNEVK